ncbi:dTDP-4-dehydro-6-deoxyglucose aminotransferase [Streptomyces sp. NPDC003077]|uniref:dTDP-4-dehydro-6-deoxyglucose aminotransferase n=1 Tax=Streptomyces sp. NPDC003077 TaxID=3154443 RepID=UPI0033AC7450
MKHGRTDLALFGGDRAFARPVQVGRPSAVIRSKFFDRLNQALDSQWLSNGGPLVREFEERVARLAGVRHCVATCNGTAGLQILARAIGLTGEVVMPSMTFAATAHAMHWLGLEPVFVDVDPRTGNLDPALVPAAVTPRTSAILGVHLWGRPCPVDELERVAADLGLPLFYDAAHAIGCTAGGRPVGGFGRAEVFSFHATKVAHAFEGGAVVTDDDTLAHRLRALQNFGIGLSDDPAAAAGGTNAKMSEAAAAMGLTSLDTFEATVLHNRDNHTRYRACLADLPGVQVVDFDRHERNNYQYVIVEVDAAVTGIHRDLLMDVLSAENIRTRPYFSPACHQLAPYRDRPGAALPHTERLAERVLSLPTGTSVTTEDVERICDVIRLAVTEGHAVTAAARAAAAQMPVPTPLTPSIGPHA